MVSAETSESAEEEGPWKGDFELGFLQADGNSKSESLLGKFAVSHEREAWKNEFLLKGFGSSSEDERTGERYETRAKASYKLSDSDFLFGLARYEKDRYGGFEYQASTTTGYGRKFWDDAWVQWNGEVGAGYRKSETRSETTDLVTEESEVVWRVATLISVNLSSNAEFVQSLETEVGDENTATVSETSVSSELLGSFFLKLSYKANHNTNVEQDREKLDTLLSISLNYKF